MLILFFRRAFVLTGKSAYIYYGAEADYGEEPNQIEVRHPGAYREKAVSHAPKNPSCLIKSEKYKWNWADTIFFPPATLLFFFCRAQRIIFYLYALTTHLHYQNQAQIALIY